MPKSGTRKTALVMLGLGVLGWMLWHRVFDGRREVKWLVNQIWIERMPANERDMVWAGVLFQDGKDRAGVLAHGSQFRVHADVLMWRLEGDKLRTHFLQENKRYDFQARTWACEGRAPRPFELCLELKRGRQVLRFYSLNDWNIDSKELPAGLAGLIPQARGALSAAQGQTVEGPEDEGPSPLE